MKRYIAPLLLFLALLIPTQSSAQIFSGMAGPRRYRIDNHMNIDNDLGDAQYATRIQAKFTSWAVFSIKHKWTDDSDHFELWAPVAFGNFRIMPTVGFNLEGQDEEAYYRLHNTLILGNLQFNATLHGLSKISDEGLDMWRVSAGYNFGWPLRTIILPELQHRHGEWDPSIEARFWFTEKDWFAYRYDQFNQRSDFAIFMHFNG